MVLILEQKSNQDLHKLSLQQASIFISEPPVESAVNGAAEHMSTTQQNSIYSATPSPPPQVTILPDLSPSPIQSPTEEKDMLLLVNSGHPATIAEENMEQDEGLVLKKSSLSLPVDASPTSPLPTLHVNSHGRPALPERSQSDRRKLSVTNIMNFGERRRSTSSIFSDMRKMSITNFDNLKSPGVGEPFLIPTRLNASLNLISRLKPHRAFLRERDLHQK